jgi:hypothetical protein
MVGLRRANRPRSRRRPARAALPSLVSFRQLASQHLSTPEGSLDEASLDALVHVLASHSTDGADAQVPGPSADQPEPSMLPLIRACSHPGYPARGAAPSCCYSGEVVSDPGCEEFLAAGVASRE